MKSLYQGWLSMRFSQATTLGVVTWLAALAIGFGWLSAYKSTPGKAASAEAHWPAESRLSLHHDKPTLVMFVHPRCPCSRSSLAELRSIVSTLKEALSVEIVFFQPPNADESWRNADTWSSARQIPGASVSCDVDGREAQRFGATTSGHTFVYAPDGQLLFCGGITAARGQVGANAGSDAILSLGKGETCTQTTPVFGCPLFSNDKLLTQFPSND
ncbi:MAG TPA: hypothetical protein VFE62_10690 [Gemmataceae bacterium]|nr:hypothetical protein [Gemmataceae bacterium]